jgi:hypothetical protein
MVRPATHSTSCWTLSELRRAGLELRLERPLAHEPGLDQRAEGGAIDPDGAGHHRGVDLGDAAGLLDERHAVHRGELGQGGARRGERGRLRDRQPEADLGRRRGRARQRLGQLGAGDAQGRELRRHPGQAAGEGLAERRDRAGQDLVVDHLLDSGAIGQRTGVARTLRELVLEDLVDQGQRRHQLVGGAAVEGCGPQVRTPRAQVQRVGARRELRIDLGGDEGHEVDEVRGRAEDRRAVGAVAERLLPEQRVVALDGGEAARHVPRRARHGRVGGAPELIADASDHGGGVGRQAPSGLPGPPRLGRVEAAGRGEGR